MKLKVCGMTLPEQVQQLNDFQVDFAGFIFYPKSPRYIGEMSSVLRSEFKVVSSKPNIQKVGVFVNAAIEDIKKAIADFDLQLVQLHGDESPEFCLELQQYILIIKAFRINNETDIDDIVEPFENACNYYLFDTVTKLYGGSGEKFNWDMLRKAQINKPFFLSGGISLDDIEKVKSFQHPYLYAIDVNSKFEVSAGVKDMDKVKSFVSNF